MPYLEQHWPPAEFGVGDWVPEIDLSGWAERHSKLHYDYWVKREGITVAHARELEGLDPPLPPSPGEPLGTTQWLEHLLALGADIGSVKRDSYIYANFLEQLKQAAPTSVGDAAADEVADNVVERMKTMGFTSAKLPEQYGGPPDRRSLRPWKGVMKWILRLLRKAGQFLLNAIRAFTLLAAKLAADAVDHISVSFAAGFPLADVGFEIDLVYLKDDNKWDIFKQFTEAILNETEKLVEA
jgi:hypothetical protein